ncbi:MAG: hypothetical protein JSU86_19115 [Phycisphaerales bacterium]|nr:MAG: hypothetical protein JSU86_19115 [Phycisphaerales bacterium]
MISPRKKGGYLAVVILGLAALAVDRCVLSGGTGEPMVAVAIEQSRRAMTMLVSPSDAAPTLSIPELPFPRGLDKWNSQSSIRDLFAPPVAVLRAESQGTKADKDRPGTDRPQHPEQASSDVFLTQHRLNGVMVDERLKIAIVDGTWIRIGQTVDGCTLTDVSGNEARFECHDREAVLKVVQTETSRPR